VYPDFPVLEGMEEVLDIVLVGEQVAIKGKAALDFYLLFLSEELSTIKG